MALNNAAMDVAATALSTALAYLQTHSGDPGVAGTANATSATRQAIAWAAPSGPGNLSLSAPVNFTGIAANGPVTYVTIWSASTSGTWYGTFPVSGDASANSSGQYTVTTLNLTGSVS